MTWHRIRRDRLRSADGRWSVWRVYRGFCELWDRCRHRKCGAWPTLSAAAAEARRLATTTGG